MGVIVARDTFPDPQYEGQVINDLYAHDPDIGAAWDGPAAGYTNTARITGSAGRVRAASTSTGHYLYTMVTAPFSADYEVSADFVLVTSLNNTAGIVGRCDPVANTMYILARASATIALTRLIAGSATSLGTAAVTWAGTKNVVLRMIGNQITALVDGTPVIGPVTDSGITAPGRAGMRSAGIGSISDAAGLHIDNFQINDLTTQPAPTVRASRRARRPRHRPASRVPSVISQSMIPGAINNRHRHVGLPFNQDTLCTKDDVQYATWPNASRNTIIGKRTLPSGTWSTFDLSTLVGNPLACPQREDEHNSCVVGVSNDGKIHVAGNHHDVSLRYLKSANAGDITAWNAPTMIGSNEISVSYPAFVRLNDGTLLFAYRDGVSGNGDLILNRYSTLTGNWGRLATVLDGNGTDGSPYWNRIATAPDGTLHVFYTWRAPGGGANDNGDICHIKSTDGGTTWKDMAGNVLTLPVTKATSPLVLDTAASGSGILNQNGCDVDTSGHPHAAFFLFDGSGKTQINHVYHDGSTWHVDQVTNLTYTLDLNVGIFDPVVSRPSVACDASGRTFIIYRTQQDGRRGQLNVLDVTSGSTLPEFAVWTTDLGYYEPTFDSCALKDRDELHMLLAPTAPSSVSNTDHALKNYAATQGRVISVAMTDLESLI